MRNLGFRAILAVAIAMSAAVCLAADRLKVEVGDSPASGPANAQVTMFEFIDFQ